MRDFYAGLWYLLGRYNKTFLNDYKTQKEENKMIQLGDLYQYVITSERAQEVLKRLYPASWEVLLSDKQLFMSNFRDMVKEQPQLYKTFILSLEVTDLRE